MKYEIFQPQDSEDDWIVTAVNDDGDQPGRDMGEIYSVAFYGSLAQERAREYMDWKNGESLAPAAYQ